MKIPYLKKLTKSLLKLSLRKSAAGENFDRLRKPPPVSPRSETTEGGGFLSGIDLIVRVSVAKTYNFVRINFLYPSIENVL